MQSSTHACLRALLLVLLMLVAPLSGCFGETEEPETVDLEVALTIDGLAPSEAMFRNLGAQTIFHLGAYDEDYSAYHSPQDTLENMVAVVGGQENLEESIEFVLWAAFLEFVLADQDPEVRNVNA